MKFLLLFAVMNLTLACQTMAPSNYELNRRAGLPVSLDNEDETGNSNVEENISKFRSGTANSKEADMPVRLPGVVEKVWVYGQEINETHWMQGTWVFVEVDNEKWLGEVDTGSGDWVTPSNGDEKGKE